MKRILKLEAHGGASGDMILGALIGLGVELEPLRKTLSSLTDDPFDLNLEKAVSHHLAGVRLTVDAPEGHTHRHLSDIKKIIDQAALSDETKTRSLAVFKKLAAAEAKVHNTTPEKIHFHEVGALDSILDIVGSCLALEWLNVNEVVVGALPIGHGTITMAHGEYPNPAPATVELLTGYPTVEVDEPFELVTPTGAALLTTWKSLDRVPAGGRSLMTVNSLGHRELNKRPNVLRAQLVEVDEGHSGDSCLVLECNLDDTTPELIGLLSEKLLESGVLDVYTTPVFMKKQRPGTLLTVLAHPGLRESVLDLIFRESTSLGVREYTAQRTILERRTVTVETPYGPVGIKQGWWRGELVNAAPEIGDCKQISDKQQVPVKEVSAAALDAFRSADGSLESP